MQANICRCGIIELALYLDGWLFAEFAVHELLLPDVAMVHGRFIVSAWEFGLDGVQDDAVKLLSLAIEVCSQLCY